ncbi:FAS1-like dehydratase domain-containing protein [Nocardia sp. R6R-6]|uniref:FAS1-like dehydratase domain-containing protein n=1 Tax=Nocardia sp. R6R-6 TaxID=3459303 RepID=UPI00403DFD24
MTLTDEAREERVIGPVTRTDFVRYAGAGGDFNPLHHDDEYARSLGLPSVFAMGMWTAGLLASFVSDRLGPSSVGALDMRFRSPVWPGDELRLAIEDTNGAGESRAVSVTAGGAPRISGTVRVGSAPARNAPDSAPPTDERLRAITATTFEDVVFPVERGKIIEFARAVHSTSPLHSRIADARAAGYPDLVAPLTFTNSLAHWSGGDATETPIRLGLDLARVVHGEQRYRFTRPMVAGDVLTARRRVGDVSVKAARDGGEMTLVSVVTEFVDRSGATVVAEEMVMIEQPARSRASQSVRR